MVPTDSLPVHEMLLSLWSENTLAGQLIIFAILGLMCIAWISKFRERRRYRVLEARSLGWAENNLTVWREEVTAKPMEEAAADAEDESDEGDDESSEDDRQMPLADVPRLMENTAADSLIRRRLQAIENMRRHHIKINVEALQQLSFNLEESRIGLKIPSFVVGMSMMLGMLGTFIGLSAVVSDINFHLPDSTSDVSVASWQQSIQNIRMVLAGMKTAFSTTLVGIVCAVLASYWDFRTRQDQAYFLEQLDRFTTEELMAATLPAFEDESLIQRVSRQLEESFADVQELFRSNRDTVRELTEAEKGFLRIVEEIQNATRQDPNSNLNRVATELIQTNTSLVDMAEHLPRMTRVVESSHRDLSHQLKSVSRALEARATSPPFLGIGPSAPWLSLILLASMAVYWLVR